MKPRTAAILVFLAFVLPMWMLAAWAGGFIRFGAEPVTLGRPMFEQTTSLDPESLSFCLSRNYANRLSLDAMSPPADAPKTTRFHNRSLHMFVDVEPYDSGGSVVRVYKLKDRPLADIHRLAIQSCIPENRLPNPSDPRNYQLYTGGEG